MALGGEGSEAHWLSLVRSHTLSPLGPHGAVGWAQPLRWVPHSRPLCDPQDAHVAPAVLKAELHKVPGPGPCLALPPSNPVVRWETGLDSGLFAPCAPAGNGPFF